MFWDRIAFIYDVFEKIYNNKVIRGTASICAGLIDYSDSVLECACGTGLITVAAAPRAASYIATDFSEKMMAKARRKLRGCENVSFRFADITALDFPSDSFDKVIAGNVIHLLDHPEVALAELVRVTRPGGKVIVPTYINKTKKSSSFLVNVFDKMGANFNRSFDMESYKKFFDDLGYGDAEYLVADGRMPCAVAVISV